MWTDRKADSRRLNEPVKAIAMSRVSEVTRDIRAWIVKRKGEENGREQERERGKTHLFIAGNPLAAHNKKANSLDINLHEKGKM